MRRLQARLRLELHKWFPPAPYEIVKRARLNAPEMLEERLVFSVNVWLPQRLVPIGGASQYNVSDALFQPITVGVQPQLDLRSASVSLAGSFSLSVTGDYDFSVYQSGPDGAYTFFFTESGHVSFTLDTSGTVAGSGYNPSIANLEQDVDVDWTFLELDGGGNTVVYASDSEQFTLASSNTNLDGHFWAGFNWYNQTSRVVTDNSLPLFALSATSFSLDENGGESYTLQVSNGLNTISGTGSVALDDLLDETGQQTYGLTVIQSFAHTEQGNNSFILAERGSYSGGHALSSVAYSEQGSSSREYDADSTLSFNGTISSSGLQSVGNSGHNLQDTSSSNYLRNSLATSTYHETMRPTTH